MEFATIDEMTKLYPDSDAKEVGTYVGYAIFGDPAFLYADIECTKYLDPEKVIELVGLHKFSIVLPNSLGIAIPVAALTIDGEVGVTAVVEAPMEFLIANEDNDPMKNPIQ